MVIRCVRRSAPGQLVSGPIHDSRIVHSTAAAKAPERERIQDPGGPFQGDFTREASWTAVALYRFRGMRKSFADFCELRTTGPSSIGAQVGRPN